MSTTAELVTGEEVCAREPAEGATRQRLKRNAYRGGCLRWDARSDLDSSESVDGYGPSRTIDLYILYFSTEGPRVGDEHGLHLYLRGCSEDDDERWSILLIFAGILCSFLIWDLCVQVCATCSPSRLEGFPRTLPRAFSHHHLSPSPPVVVPSAHDIPILIAIADGHNLVFSALRGSRRSPLCLTD